MAKKLIKDNLRKDIESYKHMNFNSYIAMILSQDLKDFVERKINLHDNTKELKKDLKKSSKIFAKYAKNADSVSHEETAYAFHLLARHFHRLWI